MIHCPQDIDKQIEVEQKESGQKLPGTAPATAATAKPFEDVPEYILTTSFEDRFMGFIHSW